MRRTERKTLRSRDQTSRSAHVRAGLLTQARRAEAVRIVLKQPRSHLLRQQHRVAPASARTTLERRTARGAPLFADNVVPRFVHDGRSRGTNQGQRIIRRLVSGRR